MDTIVYRVGEKLYINLTNKCSNNCEFCIRREGDGAYGSDSLWIECEPTAQEVIKALQADAYFPDCREVVFCGFGEPVYRIDELSAVGKFLKANGKRVRVNTNGQGNLIFGSDVTEKLVGAVDTVNVSLNASTAEKYQKLCHSVFKEQGFYAMLDFAGKCRDRGLDVVMSVVDVIGGDEVKACGEIAEKLGVRFRVRKYD